MEKYAVAKRNRKSNNVIQRSYQNKINLILTVVVATLLGGFGVFDYFNSQAAMIAEITLKADIVTRRLARSLVEPVWNFDYKVADEIIKSEMGDKILTACIVKESDSEEPFQALIQDKGGEPKAMGKGADLSKMIEWKENIVKEEQIIGTVTTYFTTSYVALELQKSIVAIIVKTIITVVLLVLILSVVMRITLIQPLRKLEAYANELEKGNLDAEIEIRNRDELGSVVDSLKEAIGRFKSIIMETAQTAAIVSHNTQELRNASEQFSHNADQLASSVESVAANMEEMSSGIEHNSDNAAQTEKIAIKASGDAKESEKAVESAVIALKNIADKITIIEEIARETNLLSLNASIEAARVGEYGKGFAVVAGEVKKLAQHSAVAASEISTLSSRSVETADTAGAILSKLIPDIQRTAELVEEITSASREQTESVSTINNNIQQFDNISQANASSSKKLVATAVSLSEQVDNLMNTISFFNRPNQ